jgi:steroid 5-alpha reductase family enzyme
MLKSAGLVIVAYLVAGAVALGVGYGLRAQHPLLILVTADTAATVVVFAFSVAANNSSVYDPYWSVAPVPIALFWLLQPGSSGFASLRHVVVFALLCLWAARLTYNWASQWQGVRHEDWRYRNMRAQTGRLYWPVSFLGIHYFPTILVFLGCLALWPALSGGSRPFNVLDVLGVLVTGGAIAIEAAADIQMRRFRREIRASGLVEPPGLWKYSRHPNYFGEVLFWWGLFLFALAADVSFWWVVIGPLCILALFLFASIPMMERHLLARRPGYALYRQRVSAFIPWPRKREAPSELAEGLTE